jgi:hypothetical protein
MILLFAAPTATATSMPRAPRDVFDVPVPSVPIRDTVIRQQSASASRITATASAENYPIGDSGSTVTIGVTSACQLVCTAADPEQVAAFLGTLIHGHEIGLVTVQMDTPDQLVTDCGFGSQACYYSGENKIVISGDPAPGPDGATRDFVLAHEYGHHVAQHRRVPAPFPDAIDWGTERWASYEHVCQGRRQGAYFPGNEGSRYHDDPGEAFAETFAFNRFPDSQLRWEYADSLQPNARAFALVRRDVLDPWRRRRSLAFKGRLAGGRTTAVRRFGTPLDGKVSLRLAGPGASRFEVLLRGRAGRRLRGSQGVDVGREVSFTTCGQGQLQAAVRRLSPPGGRFRLIVKEP